MRYYEKYKNEYATQTPRKMNKYANHIESKINKYANQIL